MNGRLRVMLLTLLVSSVAVDALADVNAQAPAAAPIAAPAPASPAEVPLALRQSHPVALAQESHGGSIAWKALFGIIAIAGGFYVWKKKAAPSAGPTRQLRIVARVGIGVRSELLVVNVDGQSLLLGVTANSMQTLATLEAPAESEAMDEVPASRESAPSVTSDRFSDLLKASLAAVTTAATTSPTLNASLPAPRRSSMPAPCEGQVSGLAAFRGER